MLSRKTARNYEIMEDGESMPYKIPRGATDRALREIRDGMQKVNQAVRRLWDDGNYGAYRFVMDRVLPYGMQHDEGQVWQLQEMEQDTEALLEELQTNDDEIPKPEHVAIPEDYGYRKCFGVDNMWEKQLRDDDEETVTEELIVLKDGEILRRLCITKWETKPGVRSSTSIRYRKLKLGKRLERACRNALELHLRKR